MKKILTERRLCELAGLIEAGIRQTPSGGFVGPTGTIEIDAVEKPDEPVDPDATQAPSTVPGDDKRAPEMPVALSKKVGRELADWFFTSAETEGALKNAQSLVDEIEAKLSKAHKKLDPYETVPGKDRAAQAEIHALSKIQNTDKYHAAEQLVGLWNALAGGVPPVVAKAQELRTAGEAIIDANGFTEPGRLLLKVWNHLDRPGLRPVSWAKDVKIK